MKFFNTFTISTYEESLCFLLQFLRHRMVQNEGHSFLLYIFHVHSDESLQMFSAFVSPYKLINILFLSLSLARDNNIKNYCLTFMCHLANIFSFLSFLFEGRLKKLFYCFTFLSALMSFYCQSFATQMAVGIFYTLLLSDNIFPTFDSFSHSEGNHKMEIV